MLIDHKLSTGTPVSSVSSRGQPQCLRVSLRGAYWAAPGESRWNRTLTLLQSYNPKYRSLGRDQRPAAARSSYALLQKAMLLSGAGERKTAAGISITPAMVNSNIVADIKILRIAQRLKGDSRWIRKRRSVQIRMLRRELYREADLL